MKTQPVRIGVRHIVECIHQHAPPHVTPEHAFHVLEILLKVQESGRDGQAKLIESTFTPLVFSHAVQAKPVHLDHDRSRSK